MTGSSVALLCGALRYLNDKDPYEAGLTLNELPEEEIDEAIELISALLEHLRRRRVAFAVRAEMAARS